MDSRSLEEVKRYTIYPMKHTTLNTFLYSFFTLLIVHLCGALFVACSPGTASQSSAIECGYITSSGDARLYYEMAGHGTPIILVHGHSLDSRMWDDQFAAFAAHHRVVRYDCRGYGRSSQQSEDFHFLHAADLVTIMDSLHIDRAHIVGLSMGGFITADMLVYAPHRMLSAVLANGHFRSSPGPSEPIDPAYEARRDSTIAAVCQEGIESYKRRWFETLMNTGGAEVERIRKPLWEMISEWSGWQATHKEVRLLLGRDGIRMLEQMKPIIPTLVLTGIEKPRPNVKAPSFMRHLPNSCWEKMEETGHMMNMERPTLFNTMVLDFISEIDESSDKL